MIGANDLARFVPPAQAAASLARPSRALRAAGTDVVVVPAPDMSSVPFVPPAFRPLVQAACAQLQRRQAAVAEAAGARSPRSPPRSAAPSSRDPAMFSADRFHPCRPATPGSPRRSRPPWSRRPAHPAGRGRRLSSGSRSASSSARCSPRRPASWSSWVRQENPSASTTASGRRSSTAGRSCCSAMATETSWWPRSTPQLPASPQQPPSRVTRAPARRQQLPRRPSSPCTDAWWQCGCATTSRPSSDGGAQPGVAASSSASVRVPRGDPLGGGAADQLERLAAQHGGARGLHADDRPSGVDRGASDSTVRPRIRRAVSSWPVVIQVSPQQVSAPGTCTR